MVKLSELITDLEEFIQNIDPDELEKEETDDKQHESSEDDDQEAEDGSDLEEGDTDREDTGDEIEEEGTEGRKIQVLMIKRVTMNQILKMKICLIMMIRHILDIKINSIRWLIMRKH